MAGWAGQLALATKHARIVASSSSAGRRRRSVAAVSLARLDPRLRAALCARCYGMARARGVIMSRGPADGFSSADEWLVERPTANADEYESSDPGWGSGGRRGRRGEGSQSARRQRRASNSRCVDDECSSSPGRKVGLRSREVAGGASLFPC